MIQKYLVWFNEVNKHDIALVGGKGANLGEMIKINLPIPPGFMITARAYFDFIKFNKLENHLKNLLNTVDVQDPKQLLQVSERIRKFIIRGKIPLELTKSIINYYEKLGNFGKQALVAIRSSATAEDLPDASFAGQQETFLNICGEANLINKVRESWASLFTPRAIFYREVKKFNHFKVGLAVVVQKMIQAETSGVIFTIDPVSHDKKKIIIEAIYGLGELIVQGSITPDHYEVEKLTFKIINKQVNRQEIQLIKSGALNKASKVKLFLQNKQKIKDEEIIKLAKIAKKIHQHYFFPQDIEWAIEKGKIYILQTRPVTTLSKQSTINNQQSTKISLPLILKGQPASPGIASGFSQVIKSAREISKVKVGEILVAPKTSPDFVSAMKKAVGIITDQGGTTSHAAIVSRELGIPCVVGSEKGTKLIKTGQVITINGKTGEVFKGSPEVSKVNHLAGGILLTPRKEQSIQPVGTIKTATKLYVNLADPDKAQEIADKDVDGVGLLRAEFIISEQIKYHPKKLIHDKKQNLFVDKLTQGLEKFCSAFNPRPVVYRTTDFKTNEYRNLIGGKLFEPQEENPLLGFRGAFRYVSWEDVFELELRAIKNVRNKLGYKNLWLMIPFVRTVNELKKIKSILAVNGLSRSPSFQLWMMVEIPSNVILLEDFIKVGLDGISVGSNDLTMLVLGIDRDNENLASSFDERDPAVLWCFEKIIKACHKYQVTSSICGQAPSQYPDLTCKLVEWGITSVSVSPDMLNETRQILYQAEKRRVAKKILRY